MKLGELAKIAIGDYWVTPRYYEFINSQRNLAAERDALMRIMTRPPRIRTNTFSASGAGRCLRERQLAFLGYPRQDPDERGMNIFANGDYVHLRWQVAGYVGGWLKEAEVSVARPEDNLTGTMDGLLINDAGLEVKSINDRGYAEVSSFGVKPDHREQIHSYMLASGLTVFYVVYENKNTNVIKEFKVERDETLIDKVVADLKILNDATAEQQLVGMLPECKEGTGRFNRCPYKKVCPLATFRVASESPRPRIRRSFSTPPPSSE